MLSVCLPSCKDLLVFPAGSGLCTPVLVLQTFTMCVGLGVFSSFCPAWSLCSHHCSISEMPWSDAGSCLLGLTWQREPGTHHFHSFLLKVCSPVPWKEHWDSLVLKQCWLKDCLVLKHGKEASKVLVVQEATLMRPQKGYCRTGKRWESDCLV